MRRNRASICKLHLPLPENHLHHQSRQFGLGFDLALCSSRYHPSASISFGINGAVCVVIFWLYPFFAF